MAWTTRDLTVAEAAQLAGLPRATLDVVIHRAKPMAVLFSEKRGGRRWFSLRDVTILRIAHDLERAGRTWTVAIAAAFECVATQPPADALLVMPVGSVSHASARVLTGLSGLPCEAGFIVLPIGRIAAEIIERTESKLVAV